MDLVDQVRLRCHSVRVIRTIPVSLQYQEFQCYLLVQKDQLDLEALNFQLSQVVHWILEIHFVQVFLLVQAIHSAQVILDFLPDQANQWVLVPLDYHSVLLNH